jgi:hypothetical protein
MAPMSGLVGLAAAICFAFGPNDAVLQTRLAATDALESRLVPWQTLAAGASPLWLVIADGLPSGPATYLPAKVLTPAELLWMGKGAVRMLPALAVPRLLLDADFVATNTASSGRTSWPLLAPLETLPIDRAEPFLHALLEARLDRLSVVDGDAAAELRTRAAELFVELPQEQRESAYHAALADFGATLLTVAHEIGRQERRRRAAGASLCALLERPASLFGHWRRTLGESAFAGLWRRDAGGGAAPEWLPTTAVLAVADKRWLIGRLLGLPWTGDPTRDFAFLCS